MMRLAERATAPESAAPCSEQNNPPESITKCAYCPEGVNVYQMGDDQYICTDHLAASVSLAASDVWPDMVHYSREFEVLL